MSWRVKVNRVRDGKKFITILDETNKREYSNYFPLGTSAANIISRFRDQVREHRADLARKAQAVQIDLSAFEGSL